MAASFCPEIRPPSQRGSTELQSSSSHSPRSSSISSSLSFSSPSSSPSFASTAFPQPPDDRGISISRGRGKNKRIGAQEAEGRKGQNRPAGSPRSPVATLESGMSFSQSSPSDSTAPAASEGEDGKAKQTSRRRKTHSRSSPIIFPVPVSPPGSLSAASSGFNCTHERPWGRETCSPAATPCVSLVDRLLSKSSQEILLSVPGYYALCVANKTDSSWDGLFMGLAQMRIVCEYSLSPPTCASAAPRNLVSRLQTSPVRQSPLSSSSRSSSSSSVGSSSQTSRLGSRRFQPPRGRGDALGHEEEQADVCRSEADAELKRANERSAGVDETDSPGTEMPQSEGCGGKTTQPRSHTGRGASPFQSARNGSFAAPVAVLKASFSPFMEDVLSAGSRRDPRKCPDQTRVSRRQDASLLMRHSQVSSPPVTTIRCADTARGDFANPFNPFSLDDSEDEGSNETPAPLCGAFPLQRGAFASSASSSLASSPFVDRIDSDSDGVPCVLVADESQADAEEPSKDETEGEAKAESKGESEGEEKESTDESGCQVEDDARDESEGEAKEEADVEESARHRASFTAAPTHATAVPFVSRGPTVDEMFEEESRSEREREVASTPSLGVYRRSSQCDPSLPRGASQQVFFLHEKGRLFVPLASFRYAFIRVRTAGSTLRVSAYTAMSLGMRLRASVALVFCGTPVEIPRNPSAPFDLDRSFMLTLDSSGVLTYTSLLILRRLEQEVQFHLGDETVHLASCFDLVAGSGFGGLVALGLLRGLTPSQMLTAWTGAEDDDACGEEPGDFLQTLLREGCMRSRVQQLLVEHLGEQFLNTFSSPPYCLVTAADVLKHPHEVFVLRSYEHMHPAVHAHAYRGTAHVPLWIAGWATCADGAQIKAMSKNDFSLLGYRLEPAVQLQQKTPSTSNPTLLALEEMSRLSGKSLSSFIQENLQLLVSIGTGKGADGSDSFFRGDGSRLHRGDKRGDIAHAWSKRNHIHREVLHWLSDTQNMYYRLNPPHLAHCNPQFMDSRQREYVRAATESYLVDDKFFDVKVMSRLLAYRVLALREKGRDAAAARPRCTPPWAGGPTAKVFPIAHVARSQS
uniref:Patatin-like phospholipase domain-containing protein, putative n=1 Tax=Neospora caninum (strain Liverpool) TaxID=572307 RepID=A0A0F7U8T0_NEOCL|nr:TPA: patatin-like phospholipase domain-containing protein, putative [Neospora caninum Liverpool]